MQQFHGKTSDKMVKVPESVRKAVEYSFTMKKMGFLGGQSTGWKRAKQLSTKDYISIQDLRYMRNWYARHIITSYPSYKEWKEDGKPKDDLYFHKKRGIIAWQIWGGDPGLRWVNKNTSMINKYFDTDYDKIV
jgi:hypothetical protein